MLGDELERQVDREPVGVVQAEGVLGGDALRAGLVGLRDQLLEQLGPVLERAPEALLLPGQPAADRLALLDQLGVGPAHHLLDDVGVAGEEARLEPEHAALLDRAAHHAAQDVAAVLVGGHDAVGDEEGHPARVVGQDPQRAVGREGLAVAAAGELLPQLDQRLELVGLEHRRHVLEDRRHAVEPQAGVDVLRRQRRERC